MNEGEGNDSFKGNAISLQKDRTVYMVFDETIKDSMKTYLDFINLVIQTPNLPNIDEMIAKALESNYPYLHVTNTLDELAAKTGIDAEGLKATVSAVQRFLRPRVRRNFHQTQAFPAPAQERTVLRDSPSFRRATEAWAESRSITRRKSSTRTGIRFPDFMPRALMPATSTAIPMSSNCPAIPWASP